MSSLNAVTIVGHLGRKPDLRYTAAQAAYAVLSVATNEALFEKGQKPRERTEWHRIVTWGRTAAACVEHLDVGRQLLVRERIRTRAWTDKHGVRRWSSEIIAVRVIFRGSGSKRTSEPVEEVEP